VGSPDDRGEVRGASWALGLQEQQPAEREPPTAPQRPERPQRSVCPVLTAPSRSVCLCPSVFFLSVCRSVSLSVSLFLSLSVCLSLSPSIFLSLFVSLSLSPFVSVSVCLSLSLSLSVVSSSLFCGVGCFLIGCAAFLHVSADADCAAGSGSTGGCLFLTSYFCFDGSSVCTQDKDNRLSHEEVKARRFAWEFKLKVTFFWFKNK